MQQAPVKRTSTTNKKSSPDVGTGSAMAAWIPWGWAIGPGGGQRGNICRSREMAAGRGRKGSGHLDRQPGGVMNTVCRLWGLAKQPAGPDGTGGARCCGCVIAASWRHLDSVPIRSKAAGPRLDRRQRARCTRDGMC